jgi:drug/metabolite transporter (DMT)-like permease
VADTHNDRPTAVGLALTAVSVVFFSWLGVATKLAFDAGVNVGTLLAGRFIVAAAALWLLVGVVRPRRPARRQIFAGLALGVGYSGHAWLYTESLARLNVGLVDLLLFTYPVLVTIGAIALRRDRWSSRRAIALALTTAGTTLVLAGNVHGVDARGAALALASAVAYSAYILCSAGQLEGTDPLMLGALATTGAALTLASVGVASGDASLSVSVTTIAMITVVGLVAVGGMATFITGIGRLGAARASIVSAVQPALTPLLGFLVFADRLGTTQLLGGALVIAAVVALEAQRPAPTTRRALAWLPRRERRHLLRKTVATHVAAGRRIVSQGAGAEAFYLIMRGRATVVRDGRVVAKLEPGDFFGEIALLRGSATTASVVAATEMSVRSLPRQEFQQAIRSLPKLARVLHDAIQRRELLATPLAAT